MTRLLPTDADLAPNAGPFRFRLSEESEDQVQADDFVGCVKSLSVNGQPLNLQTSFLTSAGILASCPISGTLCRTHDCGAGQCSEVSWRPVCVCPGGVTARDCGRSLAPIAVTRNATVIFPMSEKLQRLQLLANRGSRKPASSNEVSFTFRTEDEAGLLFAAGGATDYTRVYVSGGWCTRRDV